MNNSRRIARHFCGQRYELLTKRQSEHRQGTMRTTPPTNPASPPSRMGCARTGKLHCPVAWTTHRTPRLADSFTAAPHAYNRPNPKGAEPLLSTTPAPYLRRTIVVPGPLHVRISLAKSEHEAAQVRRWYGEGLGKVWRMGEGREGLNGCKNPYNQPIASNSMVRARDGGLCSDVACRVANRWCRIARR